MIPIATGFLLGLATSIHCAAMCGPLMVTIRQAASGRTWTGILAYHAGRILTYATLGAALGVLGAGVAASGFGRALSIVAGVVLLLMAAGRTGVMRLGVAGRLGVWAGRTWARVRRVGAGWGTAGLLIAGAANALLPCGLLLAALVGAAALGDPIHAALSMAAFGLGTTPALAVIWFTVGSVRRIGPARVARITPALLVITGLLLIARGLGSAEHDHGGAVAPQPAAVHAHGPN